MKKQKSMGLLERKRIDRAQRRRKKRIQMTVGAICAVAVVLVVGLVWKPWKYIPTGTKVETGENQDKKSKKEIRQGIIDEAKRLELSYAYDEAITHLKTVDKYEKDEEVLAMIEAIKETKADCVPVKLEEVTHIFYHSLVVDQERAFGDASDPQTAGNLQWMTTVDEFNAITKEMYDRGFVMVSIHDLYDVTTDENGKEVWKPAEILLPKGKKAFVLSLDDLSYYHSYEGYGYANRLIINDEGKVVNEYIDADGKMQIGAYDCVPLMDAFVEKYPDASYKGAKGIIALTGYNGVLGYRTDVTYDYSHQDCDRHQKKWMDAHPDFDLENERAEAKKVADAMKENGWEFASHTWGHMRVGDRSLASIKVDSQKWKDNVEPIVGAVDTIIFAHGQDLHPRVGAYPSSNEKYQYLRSMGFRIFCNVDSTQYQTFLGEDYMRQGRRNLDGYRIYKNAIGAQNNVSDLFDAGKILDPERPPVPDL